MLYFYAYLHGKYVQYKEKTVVTDNNRFQTTGVTHFSDQLHFYTILTVFELLYTIHKQQLTFLDENLTEKAIE